MKIPRHIIREVLETVEAAQDLIDAKLRHDTFLRETSWAQLEELDALLLNIQALLCD